MVEYGKGPIFVHFFHDKSVLLHSVSITAQVSITAF